MENSTRLRNLKKNTIDNNETSTNVTTQTIYMYKTKVNQSWKKLQIETNILAPDKKEPPSLQVQTEAYKYKYWSNKL